MIHSVTWRLGAVAFAAILSACGGNHGADPSIRPSTPGTSGDSPTVRSGSVTGTVFKGPVSGASVCVYAVTGGAKGALLAAQTGSLPSVTNSCVITGADGSFTFVLPAGATGDLLVESSGGTYCSNEVAVGTGGTCAGGTPVAMGSNVLRTVATAPAEGASTSAPLTLLTTAAADGAASLTRGNFNTRYGTIAGSFNAPADPATSPSTGALNTSLRALAVYVGNSTSDLGDIVTGIAGGTLVAGNTTFPVGVELAVGADSKVARVFNVNTTGATVVSTAAMPGIPGSYTRSGSTVTVTMPTHNLRDNFKVGLRFAAGTGGTATNGTYAVTVVDANTFTITDTASGTIAGGTLYRDPVTQLTGTYTIASGTNFARVTIPSHGLQSGDNVDLAFTTGAGVNVNSRLSVIDGDSFEITLQEPSATATSGDVTASVGTNYTTFDATMHPSGKWLYTVSGYECGSGSPFCWGGDTITTFRIDWQRGRLTPLGAIRTSSTDAYAIPVKLAFNPSGTRMVHQDDSLDGLVLWSVNADTGALTRVADSGGRTTSAHSVVFSPDGQHVYNGAAAFSVSDSAIARVGGVAGGNAGDIVGNTLFFSQPANSVSSSYISAYSIATPTAPSAIATLGSVRTSRDLSTRNGSTVVTSGPGGIKSYIFNGSSFAAAAPATGSGELQRDGSGTLEVANTMYRSVNLNQSGNLAVSSYFTQLRVGGGGSPSGYVFTQVGTDGRLTHIATSATAQYARSAKFIKQPTN